jgi:transposase
VISPDTAARIKACRGVYSIGDTARHFGVAKSTVHGIWTGKRHEQVYETEPVNIKSSRIAPDILVDDGKTLIRRGMSVAEAADALGVSKSTLYAHFNRAGVQAWYFC